MFFSLPTSLFGCLALEVTELASPRAEKDLGLKSVTGPGPTGETGSLTSAPYPLLCVPSRRRALGLEGPESEGSLSRGCSGILKRCSVRKTPQVSAEKKKMTWYSDPSASPRTEWPQSIAPTRYPNAPPRPGGNSSSKYFFY